MVNLDVEKGEKWAWGAVRGGLAGYNDRMGRAPRELGAGETYHVTARGNGKMRIFVDANDRLRLLRILEAVAKKYGWTGWAYCLMGNHIHLCFTTRDANLSEGMRDLLGRYARSHNRIHRRTDHLFGRRFHAVRVADDAQLLATIRYIAQNPVRAGLVERAEQWRWSSYHEQFADSAERADGGFVDAAAVLSLFHKRPTHARTLLRAAVAATMTSPLAGNTREVPAPLGTLCAALTPADAAAAALARGDPPAQVAGALGVDRSTLWRWRTRSVVGRPRSAGTTSSHAQ